MLDTKSTFDALVVKYAASPEQAERILANRFYRNISGALSGTQEYMAMEKLYELHDETDFDLVVVDTPPTRNALDFLDAPRRLSRFLDHRLFRLLIAPSRGIVRAVNVAAQTFLRTVSQGGRRRRGRRRRRLLPGLRGDGGGLPAAGRRGSTSCWRADDTAFVLVASPRRDTVEEAHFFAERLGEAGIAVRGLVVNRVHPRFGATAARGRRRAASVSASAAGRPSAEARPTSAASTATSPTSRPSPTREHAHLAGLAEAVAPAPVVWVPFLRSDVHDLDGLGEVAGHVFAAGGGSPAAGDDRAASGRRRTRWRPRRGRRPPTRRSR